LDCPEGADSSLSARRLKTIKTHCKSMKITYDPEVDVLRILFSNAPIEDSDEDKPGIIIDYDKDGNVVGMEILDASKRMDNPRAVDYAVVG
jgi:uncharacterized protein YuzE